MNNNKTEWIIAKNNLIEAIESLGYPREFGEIISKNLGSPRAMNQMKSYLVNVRPESEELIVDEMLAICSDVARWKEKKESIEANARYNEYLNSR
ncbi:hypothetical protein SAMN02910289_00695 [Lachnospiraceae bacterium RM5]|nr:hypothetical protein SAMN02910289_00695 [Lachnospiraceae bacterium RM5]